MGFSGTSPAYHSPGVSSFPLPAFPVIEDSFVSSSMTVGSEYSWSCSNAETFIPTIKTINTLIVTTRPKLRNMGTILKMKYFLFIHCINERSNDEKLTFSFLVIMLSSMFLPFKTLIKQDETDCLSG